MTIMALEVFAPSHNGIPSMDDEIRIAAYSYWCEPIPNGSIREHWGILAVESPFLQAARHISSRTDLAPDECRLIERIAELVRDLDPDIIIGWELQKASWGFVAARAQHHGR